MPSSSSPLPTPSHAGCLIFMYPNAPPTHTHTHTSTLCPGLRPCDVISFEATEPLTLKGKKKRVKAHRPTIRHDAPAQKLAMRISAGTSPVGGLC